MSVAAVRPLKVLIIDDNSRLCEAMEKWLTREPGITWVASQTDWHKGEEDVRSRHPDIILLDIDLPGVSGLDLIAPLSAAWPEAKVIMLTGLCTREHVERALDLGAAGYMVKSQEPSLLGLMLRRVAEGELVLCPTSQAVLAVPGPDKSR